ncbi:MAG TPA: hypothetical protein VK586_10710 [Streptosporangiaceae bacterium]|nr:hypothetical protein [Streptosporangiaceae bacterium]
MIRVVAALLALGIAAVHVADQGGVAAFTSPDWMGWTYRLIEAGGVATAPALLLPPARVARLGGRRPARGRPYGRRARCARRAGCRRSGSPRSGRSPRKRPTRAMACRQLSPVPSCACVRPRWESPPGSQPAARPASLSSLVEWVSNTSSMATSRA